MMSDKVKQLFDRQFVGDIAITCIIAYLIDCGYEDDESIDFEKIAGFINNNFDYITHQVVRGTNTARDKNDKGPNAKEKEKDS